MKGQSTSILHTYIIRNIIILLVIMLGVGSLLLLFDSPTHIQRATIEAINPITKSGTALASNSNQTYLPIIQHNTGFDADDGAETRQSTAEDIRIIQADHRTYLPLIQKATPLVATFGVETIRPVTHQNLVARADELGISWIRMNGRISWRTLQPEEGGPIQWQRLADFEGELLALRQVGIVPVVVVDDYPLWATIVPSSCAALREDKFGDFANFMQQLVQRYSNSTYNVYHWELGNEPDVDPRLVPRNNVFGCWGDIDDPYYGGGHYGNMLKVVSPAMHRVNPGVRIWTGGLLLDRPLTTDPGKGQPEQFLRGILEANAASHFDIIGYHWYPSYWPSENKRDVDAISFSPWSDLGGGVLGKAVFLRQILAEYGVDKPLVLNEVAFSCPSDDFGSYEWCIEPDEAFFDIQADMLVRMMIRVMSEPHIMGMSWYTLDGPAWRWGGMIYTDGTFTPAFQSYTHLTTRLNGARYLGRVDYGSGIDAYRFLRDDHGRPREIHVVWSQQDTRIPFQVPQERFLTAFDRDGNLLIPDASVQADYVFNARFEAAYIMLRP